MKKITLSLLFVLAAVSIFPLIAEYEYDTITITEVQGKILFQDLSPGSTDKTKKLLQPGMVINQYCRLYTGNGDVVIRGTKSNGASFWRQWTKPETIQGKDLCRRVISDKK